MAEKIDILVVDDSELDGNIFQEALKVACPGVRSVWVSSGEQAIALVTRQSQSDPGSAVKLVVLDLNMPMLDGIETLRRIRGSALIGSVPVLMLSSSRAKSDVDRAYRFGANVFLTKPFSFDDYVERLRVLVQHWLEFAELPSIRRA